MLSEMSRFWRRLTNKLCCMRDDDEEVTEMVIVSLRSRYEVSLGSVLTEMHRGSLLAFRRTMWLLRTVFSRWLLRLLFEGGRCSIPLPRMFSFSTTCSCLFLLTPFFKTNQLIPLWQKRSQRRHAQISECKSRLAAAARADQMRPRSWMMSR